MTVAATPAAGWDESAAVHVGCWWVRTVGVLDHSRIKTYSKTPLTDLPSTLLGVVVIVNNSTDKPNTLDDDLSIILS